jgi:hypothetical protein
MTVPGLTRDNSRSDSDVASDIFKSATVPCRDHPGMMALDQATFCVFAKLGGRDLPARSSHARKTPSWYPAEALAPVGTFCPGPSVRQPEALSRHRDVGEDVASGFSAIYIDCLTGLY